MPWNSSSISTAQEANQWKKMYQHQPHQGNNNLLSSVATFSPERHLFLQRGSASEDSGLVLSTDVKPRLKWNAELHKRFIEAVNQLGGADKATPKTIMRVMGIPGLTLYHLKSHLQKYRLGKNTQISNGSNKNVIGSALVQERAPENNESLMNIATPSNKSMQIDEALKMQIEVQRQLHEQVEVQRHLQLRIEAQGKYLQSVLEKAQETITNQNLSSAGLEGAKIQLSDLASTVSNGYFSNSVRVDTCLASSEGLQKEKEALGSRMALRPYHQDFPLSSWYSDFNEQKKPFTAPMLRDSDIVQSSARPRCEDRDGAPLPEVEKEERNEENFLEHPKSKRPALDQGSRKQLEEFGLPCLKTELELNMHHGSEGSSSCKELDLNDFRWS
ncbi:myb-related protein 1-like [Curcuma longa]|uniref:myb-related protein 1-like n=1 Tax=Curcuma longa TaxID=136217 RepID=UPI003D9EC29D